MKGPRRLSFAAGTHGGLLTREADYRAVRAPRLAPRASERSNGEFTTHAVAVLETQENIFVWIPAGCALGDETNPGVIDLIGLHAFCWDGREARRGRA